MKIMKDFELRTLPAPRTCCWLPFSRKNRRRSPGRNFGPTDLHSSNWSPKIDISRHRFKSVPTQLTARSLATSAHPTSLRQVALTAIEFAKRAAMAMPGCSEMTSCKSLQCSNLSHVRAMQHERCLGTSYRYWR